MVVQKIDLLHSVIGRFPPSRNAREVRRQFAGAI